MALDLNDVWVIIGRLSGEPHAVVGDLDATRPDIDPALVACGKSFAPRAAGRSLCYAVPGSGQFPVGRRGARLSERQPAVLLPGDLSYPFKVADPRLPSTSAWPRSSGVVVGAVRQSPIPNPDPA